MELNEIVKGAFEKAFPGEDFSFVRVLPATDPKFGDYQCNDALKFAKKLRMNPREVGGKVAEILQSRDEVVASPFEKVEIAGPGFLNLTVSSAWLADQLTALNAQPLCGIPQKGAGKTVVIDYSSPNAAKQMHIGHIRSTVIGSAIDRIFRALGYRVIADNHLGDWGTQFGILIKGYRELLTPEERDNLTVANLEKCYVLSAARAKGKKVEKVGGGGEEEVLDDEAKAWKESCKQELVKLQQGDKDNLALWRKFIDISIGEFERMYKKLGVKFDTYRGESYYNEMMPKVVGRLQEMGLAVESEGALVVNLEAEKLGVAIVRKSDGGYNYTTSDLACVGDRVREYDPERIVYVTDARQQLHFKQWFSIARKMGVTAQLVHVPFGLMSYQGKAISTREGNLIKLDDLLAEAERRARAIVESRRGSQGTASPTETDSADLRLASAIGIGAVKYSDLSHDPITDIDFSWDKALALEGNSGPYLQYAYARVCSLLEKAPTARSGAVATGGDSPTARSGAVATGDDSPTARSGAVATGGDRATAPGRSMATGGDSPTARSGAVATGGDRATAPGRSMATGGDSPIARSGAVATGGDRATAPCGDRATAPCGDRATAPGRCDSPISLSTPAEKRLALQLLEFPGAVVRAAEAYKPSVLADYLFQTAQLYSSFYQNAPILKSEEPVRSSRLALCALFGEVLKTGLGLLGIETPRHI